MNPLRSFLPMLPLLLLLLLGGRADALGDQTSDLPIFASATVNCDDMITRHRWEGNCCSLNVTAGNGCILNVMDGWCKVRGEVWTLNYNSTYDAKSCPGSEYTWQDLGMKSDPNPVIEASGGKGIGQQPPALLLLWAAGGLFGILGLL